MNCIAAMWNLMSSDGMNDVVRVFTELDRPVCDFVFVNSEMDPFPLHFICANLIVLNISVCVIAGTSSSTWVINLKRFRQNEQNGLYVDHLNQDCLSQMRFYRRWPAQSLYQKKFWTIRMMKVFVRVAIPKHHDMTYCYDFAYYYERRYGSPCHEVPTGY
ncbi:hypothetical protein BDB00DRAFT_439610 [Zychaea mexicana]|uniref:uncharacterized protein n=1 Tax=Zychaea mexicana TaxID=64656 RepID=UPI0022FEC3C1|nr:uncharacterized protein BDB00DRAFT_439610 [Zychaea mexicana]KAI9492251.1 hypothetical protein BDB00DRAFT_439610 [Zychaea mexicana]